MGASGNFLSRVDLFQKPSKQARFRWIREWEKEGGCPLLFPVALQAGGEMVRQRMERSMQAHPTDTSFVLPVRPAAPSHQPRRRVELLWWGTADVEGAPGCRLIHLWAAIQSRQPPLRRRKKEHSNTSISHPSLSDRDLRRQGRDVELSHRWQGGEARQGTKGRHSAL